MSELLLFYVAGPIMGYPDQNYLAFQWAREHLERLGHQVLLPSMCQPLHVPEGSVCAPGYFSHDDHTSACYLRGDLTGLLRCSAAFFLRGWERSRGARLKHHVASECGLQLFYEYTGVLPSVPRGGER
jgi:hypothetical protein